MGWIHPQSPRYFRALPGVPEYQGLGKSMFKALCAESSPAGQLRSRPRPLSTPCSVHSSLVSDVTPVFWSVMCCLSPAQNDLAGSVDLPCCKGSHCWFWVTCPYHVRSHFPNTCLFLQIWTISSQCTLAVQNPKELSENNNSWFREFQPHLLSKLTLLWLHLNKNKTTTKEKTGPSRHCKITVCSEENSQHQGTKREVSWKKLWWTGLATCVRSEAESMRKAWALEPRPSGTWGILMRISPGTWGENLSPYGALSSVSPREGELSFCQEREKHQPGCSQDESNNTPCTAEWTQGQEGDKVPVWTHGPTLSDLERVKLLSPLPSPSFHYHVAQTSHEALSLSTPLASSRKLGTDTNRHSGLYTGISTTARPVC